jgi:hypothetical protein
MRMPMNIWESLARRWMAARIQIMNSPSFPAYSPSISLPYSMLRYARAPSPRCRFRAPDALQFILEGKPKCLQGCIRVLIMPRLRQPPNLERNSLHFLSLLMSATSAGLSSSSEIVARKSTISLGMLMPFLLRTVVN